MVKKVTAPKTYDPGRGRPKEHLAYLNEREMAYLRSINGNNMERGPRGLPSFPPDDSLGSNSGNSGPTGGGSKGPGGPSGPNSGPSGGLGGGGKGAGSSGTQSRGPGGPSGPNSGPSQSAGSKAAPSSPSAPSRTPSSPMGGQGQSFRSPMGAGWHNRDTIDRQRAQVNSARDAIRNTPAARSDLSIGGIRTLNVGPIGTPVKVGGPAPRSVASTSTNKVSVAGGWGIQGYGNPYTGPNINSPLAMRSPYATKVQDALYGSPAPTKQIYDRVPPPKPPKSMGSLGAGYDERIPQTNPAFKYSSPLTPGMTPEDMARRGALMNKYEQEIRDIMRGVPTRTGDPISAGGVPTSRPQPTRTGDPISAGGVPTSRASISVPAKDMTVEDMVRALRPPGRREDGAFGTSSPKKTGFDADLERLMTPDISIPAPPNPEERVLKVEDYIDPSIKQGIADESVYTMGLHGYPKEQMLRPGMYADPSAPSKISKAIGEAAEYRDLVASLNRETQKVSGVDDVYDPSGEFNQEPKIPNWAQSTYTGQRPSVADASSPEPSGVESSGEVLSEDGYGYPTNPDGSPITAEDIADMPPEIQREYFDKIRHARRQDTPYPLTAEEKMKSRVAGIVTKPLRSGAIGVLTKAGSYLPGPIGEGFEKLSDPKTAVEEYERANPLRQRQIAERAGRGRGSLGIGTITSSLGGGTPDIGSGGKAEYRPIPRQFADAGQADAAEKKESGRPQAYYNWDAGVGIPSPGDPDYTLYLKYLEEKAAARAAVS